MIAPKYGLPILRGDAGVSTAFDTAWLRSTLASAAVKAGYQGWWLVDDLVEGISSYLRYDYAGSVIDLPLLENVIRSVLCDVGYQEVAVRFHTVMPCHRISLAECFSPSPKFGKIDFFDNLSERIAQIHSTKPLNIHFSDLHDCVKALMSVYPAADGDESASLMYQVVSFVRERVQALPWHPQLKCSIS